MKIAIEMRHVEPQSRTTEAHGRPQDECFAEFELSDAPPEAAPGTEGADTVQITVVLRGRRSELENPALGVTELVLNALKARSQRGKSAGKRVVIDARGVAVAF
jgi:hypothetical protein